MEIKKHKANHPSTAKIQATSTIKTTASSASSVKNNSNSRNNTDIVVERCEACNRVFRDADHLAKHRRGALCRRLLQRTARRHRKMALADQQQQLDTAIVSSTRLNKVRK